MHDWMSREIVTWTTFDLKKMWLYETFALIRVIYFLLCWSNEGEPVLKNLSQIGST